MKSPLGDQLQHAMHVFDKVQTHYFALAEKQDEIGMTGIKAITIMTFSILKKIADGKMPSELDKDDWKDIASDVSQFAVLTDDQQYSVFIFSLCMFSGKSTQFLYKCLALICCDKLRGLNSIY